MPNGKAFINALTICEVEVEVANEEYEMVKETVRLGYYKSHLNKALQDQVQVFFDSPNNLDQEDYKAMLYPAFVQLVGWWNVKRGEEMWPLTAEDIQPMDLPYISALLFGVLRHSRTGKTAGEARGEDSTETKKLTPSSATSDQEAATISSPMESSPTSLPISISQRASQASNPGNGKKRPSVTTNARRSGSRQRTG